ncbi:hypothetical protein EBR66_02060 [bacterium]|nr:hypothetical protein [bacterium]
MKPEKMIRKILWWMLWGVLILFGVVWLVGGGITQVRGKAADWKRIFGTPLPAASTTNDGSPGGIIGMFSNPEAGTWFQLPWQPQLPSGPIATTSDDIITETSPTLEEQLSEEVKTFGAPTRRVARIMQVIPSDNTKREYVMLQAVEPVSLSGWSLQSVSTGARYVLPRATNELRFGTVNQPAPIALEPSGTVMVVTGVAPFGISYRTNDCTDTLSPALGYSAEEAAAAYNECFLAYANGPAFLHDSWNLYLSEQQSVWKDHDTIRLLDSEGQVVDMYEY